MSKARDIADLGAVTSRLDTVGASDGALSNRNLIINGAMRIDQRNSGVVNPTTYVYGIDRWFYSGFQGSNAYYTMEQSTDAPEGFTHSLLITSTTSTNPDGLWYVRQAIEGYNISQLAYGTANAKAVTASFWVKGSVTGDYGIILQNNTVPYSHYTTTYTVNTANTWEYKTVTISGDTSLSPTIDNAARLRLVFPFGANTQPVASNSWQSGSMHNVGGTCNFLGTNGATLRITGVQLEVGSQSTDFEHIPYSDQLARCQRYFQRFGNLTGNTINGICNINVRSATDKYAVIHHPVVPRAQPTVGLSSYSDFILYAGASSTTPTAFAFQGTTASGSTEIQINTASFGSSGWGGWLRLNSSTGYLDFDMEL